MIVVNNFINDSRVYKEAKSLTKSGYKVTIFALKDTTTLAHETMDGFEVNRIHLQSRKFSKLLLIQLVKYIEFIIRSISLIRKHQPDIIHAHDINGLIPGTISAKLINAKLVYDSHEYWAERKSKFHKFPGGKTITQFLERFLIKRADAVISVSGSIIQELKRLYRLPAPILIRNCQEYHPPASTNLGNSKLTFESIRKKVIYPGNLSPGRGLENLIESCQWLDNIHITIMGKDNYNGYLQKIVERKDYGDRITFLPPVNSEDVNTQIAECDLGIDITEKVDLSNYYALGNKIFHIIMVGLPVVVSNHPDKRQLVEKYQIGTVCNENDPHGIADAIKWILEDEERYYEMCQNARKAAKEELNWEIESRKLLSVYEGLQDKL